MYDELDELYILDDDDLDNYFYHDHGHGMPHEGNRSRSGHYPWGSGENGYQRRADFSIRVKKMKEEDGMSDSEIAKNFHMTVGQLNAALALDRADKETANFSKIMKMREKGMNNSEIAKELGRNESVVRSWFNKIDKGNYNTLLNTMDILKEAVKKDKYIDVSEGVERYLGISRDKLEKAANALYVGEDYFLAKKYVPQAFGSNMTTMLVLAGPDADAKDVQANLTDVKLPFKYSQDGGVTYVSKEPPVNIARDRIFVRYAEDGGADRDGTIELRRGVEDLNLGNARYAQVRIGVEGDRYMKGVAMYGDVPEGYDCVYNTNKKRGASDEKVFKPQDLNNPINPFGASLKPEDKLKMINRYYTDKDGDNKQSALNIVNEEGAWAEWSKSLASQFLGKQDPSLAKKQLKLDLDTRKADFDEIMTLTNPVIKEKLLLDFADQCDTASVHLSAAAMKKQATKLLLPEPSLKDNEIYAPHLNNGDEVVLVRYPHGGIFEIPTCVVNNNNPNAKKYIGNAKDAVGISPKTASILSGADFDGDTAIVIPISGKGIDPVHIRTAEPLKGLVGFDTKDYKMVLDPGQKVFKGRKVFINEFGVESTVTKQVRGTIMGKATNLITDMSIKGASLDELERAVKYSMVAVDAYKHGLDYKGAYDELRIADLQLKYQGKKGGGSSTLLSQSTAPYWVDKREGGPRINEETGELEWRTASPDKLYGYHPKKGSPIDPVTGKPTEWERDTKPKQQKVKKGSVLSPEELMSEGGGTEIEHVYADYINEAKSMANKARLESLQVGSLPKSKKAKEVYAKEVADIQEKIDAAERNKPRERQAQLLVQKTLKAIKEDNPELYDDTDSLKKVKTTTLEQARKATGASRLKLDITDKEWEAIQAGAVTKSDLQTLLKYADGKRVRELALPKKEKKTISKNTEALVRSYEAQGYSSAEIAERLGMSVETVNQII